MVSYTVITTSGSPIAAYAQGRYVYITNYTGNSLTVVDVSNLATPVKVGVITTGLSAPYDVKVQGRYAYVASYGNSALVTFDLGGGYLQQVETGSMETGTVSVANSIKATDASLWGSLGVSMSLGVNGAASFNGGVVIGTTSQMTLLDVSTSSSSGATNIVAHFQNASGSCYINPITTSLSCSSDARLKTNIVPLDSSEGLAAVLKLNPVTYNWLTEASSSPTHTGFIAQDVLGVFPDLVTQEPNGYYTLNYAGFVPYLVKAIQQMATISGSFKDTLVAWLGNSSNGIGSVFTHHLHSKEVCVKRPSGGEFCVDGDQMAAVVAGLGVSGATSTPSSSSTATTTPPTLQINGNNPATIDVGTSYNDLGAVITAPQADTDLGITVVVDDATSTNGTVTIDTSKPGTHTILYTVTDAQGLTGSVTRTVDVVLPVPVITPADSSSTSATSSDATTTAS